MTHGELTIQVGRRKIPFSLGQIVEGLQAAGVLTDDALAVAEEVEQALRDEGRQTVPLDEVREMVAERVRTRVGDKAADHWRTQTPPFVPITL